jgi:hypothetical protein
MSQRSELGRHPGVRGVRRQRTVVVPVRPMALERTTWPASARRQSMGDPIPHSEKRRLRSGPLEAGTVPAAELAGSRAAWVTARIGAAGTAEAGMPGTAAASAGLGATEPERAGPEQVGTAQAGTALVGSGPADTAPVGTAQAETGSADIAQAGQAAAGSVV